MYVTKLKQEVKRKQYKNKQTHAFHSAATLQVLNTLATHLSHCLALDGWMDS